HAPLWTVSTGRGDGPGAQVLEQGSLCLLRARRGDQLRVDKPRAELADAESNARRGVCDCQQPEHGASLAEQLGIARRTYPTALSWGRYEPLHTGRPRCRNTARARLGESPGHPHRRATTETQGPRSHDPGPLCSQASDSEYLVWNRRRWRGARI